RHLEIAIHRFDRYDWREGAELVAELDVAIEPVAHLRGGGRRQDAAMTERARTEFERTIHPPHDTAGCQVVGGLTDQRVLVFPSIDDLPRLGRHARQLDPVKDGTPERGRRQRS